MMAVLVGAAVARAASLEAENLRCEYLTDPLGIDVTMPRLSWVIGEANSEILNPKFQIQNPKLDIPRGQRQRAYQVLVASTPDLLANDQGDLWDRRFQYVRE